MPLNNFMTATATTTRSPAMVGGKRGDPVTHLENVKITSPMLPDSRRLENIRKAIGLDGTAIQVFEIFSESHAHTDDSTPVTQVPDIVAGDRLKTGGITYDVRVAEVNPATTSFGVTLNITLTEDRRA